MPSDAPLLLLLDLTPLSPDRDLPDLCRFALLLALCATPPTSREFATRARSLSTADAEGALALRHACSAYVSPASLGAVFPPLAPLGFRHLAVLVEFSRNSPAAYRNLRLAVRPGCSRDIFRRGGLPFVDFFLPRLRLRLHAPCRWARLPFNVRTLSALFEPFAEDLRRLVLRCPSFSQGDSGSASPVGSVALDAVVARFEGSDIL